MDRQTVAYLLLALMGAALALGLWRYLTRDQRRQRRYLADQARWQRSPPAAGPALTSSEADR